MKKFLLAIALFCAIQINQNEAISVPTAPITISYQGVLTDGSDELVADGTYSVTFKLYDLSSGGTALWTETQSSVATVNGLFNVDLGSVTSVTGVDFTKQLYLEVTVGSTVLSPRIKFTAQPYAFIAKTITETLPIAKGGTGATTTQGAKDNLGISTLETDVNALETNYTTLDNKVTSIDNDVNTLQSDVNTLETNLTTLNSEVNTIETDVNALESDVFTLQTVVLGINKDITDLQSEIDRTNNEVDFIKVDLSNLNTDINDLETAVNGLGTISTQAASSVEISGGTINGTSIGATTASTGAFTTLSATSDAIFNGVTVGKGAGNVSSNTALGNNTLTANTTGANNSAVGQNALALNTTGAGNTAVGRNALSTNTTGSENTALGRNALNFNTATGNTGIGYYALRANTTAIENTAVGNYSQEKTTTGEGNNSFGASSLRNNTTGHDNVAMGTDALKSNTTGYHNVAIGDRTLATQTGDFAAFNTAVGSTALHFNEGGTGNTALGFYAGVGDINIENLRSVKDEYATFVGYQASRSSNVANTTKLENITAIGKNAQVGASNSIVLGGTGVDAVNVGIGLTNPTAALDISVVAGRQGALITKQAGNSNPGLEINTLDGATGTTLKVSQAGPDNGVEIEYSAADVEASGLLINIKNEAQQNNTDANGIRINNELHGALAKGINLNMYGNGVDAKGIEVYMEGEGHNQKGIDISMVSGTGLEQKGIYIDLASGYDFDAEDNRMGAAIGINDGIGLMVANTSNTEVTTVKLATNNNALEIVGNSSITGSVTLEGDSNGDELIQSTGTGEFLVSSNGSLKFESANDNDITIAPGTGGNLVIPIASKGAGKVLTSDASGNATWQTPASGGSAAVPTVLQAIFTNETIALPTSGSFVLELEKTVTGAKSGDAVIVNLENLPALSGWDYKNTLNYYSYVSANDKVKIRFHVNGLTQDSVTLTGVKLVITVIRPIAN